MEINDIIEDLDYILEYFLGNGLKLEDKAKLNDISLYVGKRRKNKVKLTSTATELCLGQLLKKDFIEPFDNGYRITYEGILFAMDGGYTQQRKDIINERRYKINLDDRSFHTSVQLNRGTWWLVAATLGLLLFESVKFVHSYFHYPFP